MCTKRKLVLGVGVNDAEYRGLKRCLFLRTWRNLLYRCYDKRRHVKRPTYRGCTVCDEWLTFSNFKAWMERQDWQGKHLDKDILVPGNRIYSPEMCVFVEARVNTFLLDCGRSKGKWPTGVRQHVCGRFQARCQNPFSGRSECLGSFGTPEEAHAAWRQRKHELACRYAATQTDPRVAQALRTRFAMHE